MGKCKWRNRAQISADNWVQVQRAAVATPGALHVALGIMEHNPRVGTKEVNKNMSLGAGPYNWEHHSGTGKTGVNKSCLSKSISGKIPTQVTVNGEKFKGTQGNSAEATQHSVVITYRTYTENPATAFLQNCTYYCGWE